MEAVQETAIYFDIVINFCTCAEQTASPTQTGAEGVDRGGGKRMERCARSHKSRAAVDYTPIGVEPHGPTQGVWPIATVANDSQLHLVASSI